MATISIHKAELLGAEQLAASLERRMANVTWYDENANPTSGGAKPQPVDAFICSASYEKACGGRSALVEKVRAMKAAKVLIISHDATLGFQVHSEMRGAIMTLNMASTDCTEEMLGRDVPHNYSLQMATSLLLDSEHVAVADKTSLDLMALAQKVSKTDVTVFINGPTGTGKEVLSKFIHNQSSRCDAPFVAVNCAAIPENMLEAILFGHEKGAFTGASTSNKGIFRAADGGTLLLDEISEMPLSLQAKLLRALQERKVTPLGSQREVDVDVRVVATTNRNMLDEVKQGKFREDLFYRLNVFPLSTRHLSERRDDIVAISTVLLKRHSPDAQVIPALDSSAVRMLMDYGWPGNVRELENVLQRALVLCSDGVITAADIMVDGVFEGQGLASRSSHDFSQHQLQA